MFDWAILAAGHLTAIMKFIPQYVGIVIVVIGLLAIPRIQYRKDKREYFLTGYEAYKALKKKQISINGDFEEGKIDMLKYHVVCCANGSGTSLMMKMTADKVVKR